MRPDAVIRNSDGLCLVMDSQPNTPAEKLVLIVLHDLVEVRPPEWIAASCCLSVAEYLETLASLERQGLVYRLENGHPQPDYDGISMALYGRLP